MNLEQLHQYLGDLIEAGTDRKLPVVLAGQSPDYRPHELSESMIIDGVYQVDPAPLARGYTEDEGRALLLYGVGFNLDVLNETHRTEWPLVDAPEPEREYIGKLGEQIPQ